MFVKEWMELSGPRNPADSVIPRVGPSLIPVLPHVGVLLPPLDCCSASFWPPCLWSRLSPSTFLKFSDGSHTVFSCSNPSVAISVPWIQSEHLRLAPRLPPAVVPLGLSSPASASYTLSFQWNTEVSVSSQAPCSFLPPYPCSCCAFL